MLLYLPAELASDEVNWRSRILEADLGVSLEKLEVETFYNRIGELCFEGLFC